MSQAHIITTDCIDNIKNV